jgi:hypothetical protein
MDLDREVLRSIINDVSTPGGIGITMARNAVRSLLVKTCAAACSAAWVGSKPALDLAKTVVEEKVSVWGALHFLAGVLFFWCGGAF